MKFIYTLKTSFSSLATHKSRSALTILGIVIGITSIILIMSLGKGAQELILNQIRGMGSAVIAIDPGRKPQGLSDFSEIFTDSLREKDVVALKNPANVQGIKKISPLVSVNASVTYGSEGKRAMIIGGSNLVAEIFELKLEHGQSLTDDHIAQRADVAILGSKLKQELFSDSDAVGEKVKIKGRAFRVIGVIAEKGQGSMFDIDNMVLVPYTTAQYYLLGISHYHEIIVQAESEEMVPRVARDIEITLREQHGITDPEKDDFYVTTMADAMERVGMVMTILTVFLSSIAAISLIVGGVGIMNIMLVSVLERTREVGLRKSLGATDKNILLQFMTESIILTMIGGLVGITLGASFAFLASLILKRVVSMGWVFTVSVDAILLGLGVAVFVGVVFGLYPAFKASKKSPIEALRYE